MGLEIGTAALIGSALSAGTSIIGGMQQQSEAKHQANLAEGTAIARAKEEARIAAKEAGIEKEASEDAVRRQKLAYMKSGVSLEGSPLLMMEATRQRGARNVDEIMTAGGYGASATLQEGRMRASNYRSSGRQAFIGGLTNAIGTGTQYATNRQMMGG